MIIARNEQEIDRILDYFIAEGFVSCTAPYKPMLDDWREWIKEIHFKESESGVLIFVPHWDYNVQKRCVEKTLNWHDPETLDQFIKNENQDADTTRE